jgi:membrane-bound lytic murein transglycosylase D
MKPRRTLALVGASLLLLLGGCASLPAPEADAAPAVAASDIALVAAAPPAAAAAAVSSAQETAPEPVVIATPSQMRRLAPDAYGERDDLWQRVREGFAMPGLDGNGLVPKWEQWYASRPDYVQRMTERGSRYLFHIVEEVQRRGLPTELALLPFIESAFNPQALSVARAAGMWQFMPATGRDFELKQNLFRDDRRDVLASTRAALDYLQRLHGMFGDWHLALAAYNWGQGNVQRAITRNRKAGLPTDYASLRMPDETRNYVPKLLAVKHLVAQPEAHAVVLPPLENHPFFLSVTIERDIDVALAARLAGITPEVFLQLNPQMNKPVILAAGTPQVLLPYDNAHLFIHALQTHQGPLASWTTWVAPRTVKPAEAARKIGMPEDQLRELNRIPPRMLVQAGSILLVPRDADRFDDVAGHIADNAAIKLVAEQPPLRRVAFKAGPKGDSVAAVARRYRVSAAQVAQWNGVGLRGRFKVGQTIVVMLPPRAARPSTRAAAAVKPKATVQSKAKAKAKPKSKAKPVSSRAAKPAAAARKPAGGR